MSRVRGAGCVDSSKVYNFTDPNVCPQPFYVQLKKVDTAPMPFSPVVNLQHVQAPKAWFVMQCLER